jgi:sulfatase maturation enzyme AslB (radical SAM superfamily)
MQQARGCASCEWNFICHHGCQHYRTPAGENHFCPAYREFFRYTRQRFETLAGSLLTTESQGSRNAERTSSQSDHDTEKVRSSG